MTSANVYSIDAYVHLDGGRAHVVGRNRDWEAWSFGVGDLRSDPRWGTDLDWMAQELMDGFATYFHDGETFKIVYKRMNGNVVFVDVDVTGEPDDDDEEQKG